jgi:hypothetical protein
MSGEWGYLTGLSKRTVMARLGQTLAEAAAEPSNPISLVCGVSGEFVPFVVVVYHCA